jgi:hypothetical protein
MHLIVVALILTGVLVLVVFGQLWMSTSAWIVACAIAAAVLYRLAMQS